MQVTLRRSSFIAILAIILQILVTNNVSQPKFLDFTSSEMQFSDTSNSANFSSSGGSDLVISGEPAFVGDSLTASLMVTNKGNNAGSVCLQITHSESGQMFQGEYISISPGSTREVQTSFTMEVAGANDFNWQLSVLGENGHTNPGGNLSIEVSTSQTLNLTTESITWSSSRGLEIGVSVFLSEGKPRPILLTVSSDSAEGPESLQEILIEADPGRRVIDFSLGNPETTEITIHADPQKWKPSVFSQNITKESVAAPNVDPLSVKLEAVFTPEKPSPGSRVLVTITVTNDDVQATKSGTLRLISSSERTILAETSVPSLMPGSTVSTEMPIPEWIERNNVDIEVQWSSEGVISSRIYSIEPNIADQGLELPFDILAAGYGILAGTLIVLVGTFSWRAVSSRTPTTSDLRLRDAKEAQGSHLITDKREINCTFCEQRLMVPNDHQGAVRCPSCNMDFMIRGDDELDDGTEKIKVVKSSEDILHCPQCDQALRVGLEKRPVMSRCPVCKTQFMAESEGALNV